MPICLAAFSIAASAPASAGVTDAWGLTAEYQTGSQTATGYFGLNLDVQPMRWLSVAGGIGWSNYGNSSQQQLMLAPRARWPITAWLALSAGVTLSQGKRNHDQNIPPSAAYPSGQGVFRTWSPGYRIGPELSLELNALPRGRLRLFTGMAFPIDEPTCWVDNVTGSCQDARVPQAARGAPAVEPYVGLALGWTAITPPGHVGLLPNYAWYGWQTLLLDAGAAVMVAVGEQEHSAGFHYAAKKQGPYLFALGGPVIHLTHRRPLASLLSLPLRGGLVGGMFLLAQSSDKNDCVGFQCGSRNWMIVGATVASITDAVLLGRSPASAVSQGNPD